MATPLTALQSAALETALALRECGELDENMYPAAASATAASRSSTHQTETGQPNFGSTKRRQYYYKQAAKYLTTAPPNKKAAKARDCRSVTVPDSVKQDDSSEAVDSAESVNKGTRYRLYALDLRLSCPIPDDQGSKFDWKFQIFKLGHSEVTSTFSIWSNPGYGCECEIHVSASCYNLQKQCRRFTMANCI